ncbi:MAG TPA: hypothetical protein VGD91_27980 [Trebonia sp.]
MIQQANAAKHGYPQVAEYPGGPQRIVRLGEAGPSTIGNPHDAMYPLHRFVHWMAHEDGAGPR